MWIDFTAIVLGATDNMSAGKWNARLPPKQEWVVWGETKLSFPLLAVYVASPAFSFSVWSNYFHGKHNEISAALWSCPSRPFASGWFIRASGRKKVWVIRKCYLSYLAEISRLASTLGELDKGAEGPQQIRYRYHILSARRFRRSTSRSLQNDLQCDTGWIGWIGYV